ncbi:uncharacterized protein LOC126176581 [Schistocerca cancellata]|uniref:uncharacterized protein LOC126176581 n=1 Tax=Schistocerca cancellata TaxID=274614 RepID=UPI00211924E8|nr:uncharacterized protein LOC126176581 [Schistocerca cancellata]
MNLGAAPCLPQSRAAVNPGDTALAASPPRAAAPYSPPPPPPPSQAVLCLSCQSTPQQRRGRRQRRGALTATAAQTEPAQPHRRASLAAETSLGGAVPVPGTTFAISWFRGGWFMRTSPQPAGGLCGNPLVRQPRPGRDKGRHLAILNAGAGPEQVERKVIFHVACHTTTAGLRRSVRRGIAYFRDAAGSTSLLFQRPSADAGAAPPAVGCVSPQSGLAAACPPVSSLQPPASAGHYLSSSWLSTSFLSPPAAYASRRLPQEGARCF